MNRRGFTVVELLTTVAILGLLASLATPRYQQLRKRANAAEIVTAMTTIRSAAYQYTESAGGWPATASLGTVPTGLGGYLPGGGARLFNGSFHQMGWITLSVGSGSFQLVYASISDGTICTSVYGLLGGAKNTDLIGLCSPSGGYVFLWVDH